MKDLYYNLDDAEFVDQSGEKLSRFVPELFYQENAVWRIFLRDRENQPCGISGIIAWSAAVDRDYDSETPPMCRVLPESISADPTAGSVTVTLDAATAEFLAAVNGVAGRKAFFELHGVDAAGDRKLYLGFEIFARMILDPAPGAPQQVPEIFATKFYADLTAANAASGAIFSGAEFRTSVGGYLLTYTSEGGLAVSGGGVQLQLSSGGIVASAVGAGDYGNCAMLQVSGGDVVVSRFDGATGDIHQLLLSDGAIIASGASGESVVLSGGTAKLQADDQAITVDSDGGITIAATNPGRNVNISCEPGEVLVNSRPVLTALASSIDSETTAVSGGVLSGGIAITYTQPLTVFGADSITSDCRAMFDFTAASGATLAFGSGAGIRLIGLSSLDSGAHYLVAVDGARVVVNSYTVIGE